MACSVRDNGASKLDASEHIRLNGLASLLTSKPISKSYIRLEKSASGVEKWSLHVEWSNEVDQSLGMNAMQSVCEPEPSRAAPHYMWKWGDRNRIATLNPARWSKYQSVASMLKEFQDLNQSHLSRPVKIKDRGGGTWKFSTVAEAMNVLTAALDNGGHNLNQLMATVENRGHLRSQSTDAELETSSPEALVDKKRSRSAMWPSLGTWLADMSSPQGELDIERSGSARSPSDVTCLAETSSPQADLDVEGSRSAMAPSAGTLLAEALSSQADGGMKRCKFEMLPSVGTWLAARPFTHQLQKAASCEVVDGNSESKEIELQKHSAGVAPQSHRVLHSRNLRSGDRLKRLSWCK